MRQLPSLLWSFIVVYSCQNTIIGGSVEKGGEIFLINIFFFPLYHGRKYLYQLAEFVLPSDVLHYFSIVKIESDTSLLRIYLDEKMEKELSDDLHFEPKGFMEAVEVTDFPIRDHKVILVLRRRRWIDIRTGKVSLFPCR